VAVQLEEVEGGEGHGAARPMARFKNGMDALAAIAGDEATVALGAGGT
jgi:hypothetical protein